MDAVLGRGGVGWAGGRRVVGVVVWCPLCETARRTPPDGEKTWWPASHTCGLVTTQLAKTAWEFRCVASTACSMQAGRRPTN